MALPQPTGFDVERSLADQTDTGYVLSSSVKIPVTRPDVYVGPNLGDDDDPLIVYEPTNPVRVITHEEHSPLMFLWGDDVPGVTVAGGYEEPTVKHVLMSGAPNQFQYARIVRREPTWLAPFVVKAISPAAQEAMGIASDQEQDRDGTVDPTVFGRFNNRRRVRARVASFGRIKPFVVPEDFAE